MPSPKVFMIQVLANINADGSLPPATFRSYYDGTPITGALKVNVGDHVGWLVQVVLPNMVRKSVPYSLDFSGNQSFFGTSSLSVAAGGPSPFLRVMVVQDKLKYSVIIPGLETIDPDIQSGGDTGLHGDAVGGDKYVVSWDTSNPTYPMTYTKNAGTSQPLPVPNVAVGDQFTFNATVPNGAVVANFSITFGGLDWASPFDANNGSFSAAGATTAIDPKKKVGDTADQGASFAFTAAITVNGQSIMSGVVAKNAIQLA